jgi:hypothetical protein
MQMDATARSLLLHNRNTIPVKTQDDSQFEEILRELDEIRRIASDLTPEEIDALQRHMVAA